MARASASVAKDGDRWVLHLRSGAAGGGGSVVARPLREKPPVPEDAVVVSWWLAEQPQPISPVANGGSFAGVNSSGGLVPWFGNVRPVSEPGAPPRADGQTTAAPQVEGGDAGRPPDAAAAAQAAAEASGDAGSGRAAGGDGAGPGVAFAAAAEAARAAVAAAPPSTRMPSSSPVGAAGTAAAAAATAAVDAPAGGGSTPLPPTGDAGGGGGAAEPGSCGAFSGGGAEGDEEAERGGSLIDTQCALCDDGGALLACDGPCARSFHVPPNKDGCNTLGLPEDLAALLMDSCPDPFLCPNCLAGVHQCFKCKEEGAAGSEVFKCIVASCGRHYHPECAGVVPGQPVACKLHTCAACNQPAVPDQAGRAGELVPCRRCPLAFHRRCLPPELPRRRSAAPTPRVWLADRDEELGWLDGVEQSLLYCRDHPLSGTGQALFLLPPGVDRHGRSRAAAPYSLLRPDLQAAALQHYARQHRHLASSRRLLAEERAAAGMERAAIGNPQKEAVAGAGSSSDWEDEPLAAKRRRLLLKARGAGGAACGRKPAAANHAAAIAAGQGAADGAHPVQRGELELELDLDEDHAGEEGGRAAAGGAAVPPGASGGSDAGQPAAAARGEQGRQGQPADQLEEALQVLAPVPSRQQRQARLRRLILDAEDDPRFAKDSLRRDTRRPEPYRRPMKKTINEAKLQALERAVEFARSRRPPDAELLQLLDAGAVRSALSHHHHLSAALEPYLQGDGYCSYGRRFTSQDLLQKVADRLSLLLSDSDQVVDFCCGENRFVPLLKKRCLSMGFAISGRAYDVVLAKDSTDFVLQSWFDVQPGSEGLAPEGRLCICLCPPFGENGILARKFVAHAAAFRPRLMALIVPPTMPVPPRYLVVLENSDLCRGEEFAVPGAVPGSRDRERPVLRVMIRRGYPTNLAPPSREYEVLLDCTAAARERQTNVAAVDGGAEPLADGHGGSAAPPDQPD